MPIAGQRQRSGGRGKMHKKQRCHEMPKGLEKKNMYVRLCIGKGELILIAPLAVSVQWKALANY